jgi:diketogulonate reductase-like aldo/keto reductase
VDTVDSLVLHGPLPHMADTLTVWKAMEDLHEAGLAKQLGMSNFYSTADFKRFYDKVRVKPAVLQNRWVGETRHDRALRAFCREKNIVYQSFWTLTGNPRLLESGVVRNIARSLDKTPEQVRLLSQFLELIIIGPTSSCLAHCVYFSNFLAPARRRFCSAF